MQWFKRLFPREVVQRSIPKSDFRSGYTKSPIKGLNCRSEGVGLLMHRLTRAIPH